jgi:hypothetical protein
VVPQVSQHGNARQSHYPGDMFGSELCVLVVLHDAAALYWFC